MEGEMFQDLRFGVRMLLKNPGLTLIAIFTLGLGIGANTAIFSVVNAVLLRPLPGFETDRLVIIRQKTIESDSNDAGGEAVKVWRQRAQSFEQIEAGTFASYTVAGDPPESLQATLITAGYFSLYRVRAALGRLFLPGEDSAGRDRVAVLDHDYWQRRFRGDPQIVGQTIKLNKEDFVIVGVAPGDFHPLGRGRTPFYLPLALDKYDNTGFWVVARLKPGFSLDRARAEMVAISRRLAEEDPQNYRGVEANLVPIREAWVAQIRSLLRLLFAAVTIVLLIACANVANLLLARNTARRQEFAIRMALGASRLRLARQMVVECLLLAFIGGGIGLLWASWIVSALGRLNWLSIPRLDEVNVSPEVLGFALLSALGAGLLCCLGPALILTRQGVNRALASGGRAFTGNRVQSRTRHALIVAEIALTFALLYAAGLVTQSFARMQRVDLGYDPRHLLTFSITMPETAVPAGRQFTVSYDRLADRIRRLSGVEQVGLTINLPTGDGHYGTMDVKIEGRPAPPHNGEASATLRIVSGDYFHALRIPLLQGRLFDERDTFGRPDTVMITQSVARRFFPNQNPLGQRLMIDWLDPNLRAGNDKLIAREIVGVVGDIKQTAVTDEGKMELFVPYGQNGVRFTMMVVRTTGDPKILIPAIRREVAREDKDLPIADVKTMEERVSWLTAQSKTSVMLFGIFAALALLLAAIGIYGVMAYAVTQRAQEIGIRMALGAQARDMFGLVIWHGVRLTLVGAMIGLIVSSALIQVMKSLLFEVGAIDLLTFGGVALLLGLVALLACYLPARRATKVDPISALQHE
jgi:putative ABC transport system permease protein